MEMKYRRLVNSHQQRVYSQALRILGNRAEAEDITQEVYEKLWKHISGIDETLAGGWLKRVCDNACFDLLRKRRPVEEFTDAHVEVSEGGLAQALHQSRLSAWLKKAIAALKEPYRSIVIMADIQECHQRDIAKQCALNENQVKVYLHRARKQLRAKLQGVEL